MQTSNKGFGQTTENKNVGMGVKKMGENAIGS